MVTKLLHHRKTEDVLVRCVNEDMDSDQTGKEFPLILKHTMNIPLGGHLFIVIYRTSIYDSLVS